MAFDHAGTLVWKKDLGPYKSQHGGGVSPIVYEDMVILANEQDGDSFLIAVDAATGKTRWQTARQTVETAYSTPCVYSPRRRQTRFDLQQRGSRDFGCRSRQRRRPLGICRRPSINVR